MNITRLALALTVMVISAYAVHAQRIEILHSGSGVSFRGLSVVNEHTIWVSGSKGTVALSTDSGNSWGIFVVYGYEDRDFRDIEGFNASTAVIIAVGEPAVILRTIDGGRSWKKVYENATAGMFLDALDFWNSDNGIVLGDPVNGRFFFARTFDGGKTWKDVPASRLQVALPGEACFAASGTNIRALDRDEACFVSGGSHSRLFWNGRVTELPLLQGKETQGANSVAVWQRGKAERLIVAVGGDFNADSLRRGNCVVSRDGGKTWIRPSNPPYGYRSCVEFLSANRLVTCGLSGVDLSLDQGINWGNISSEGFHVCRKSRKGDEVFLAGDGGRIARIIF